MKKISFMLILLLTLSVAAGCGSSSTKKTEPPKDTTKKQSEVKPGAQTPHDVTFPPATAQDKAELETAIKDFFIAVGEGKADVIKPMIYKSTPESVKALLDNIKKNEVKSFEFTKVTGITANNGLAAVGYVVMEEMGTGMKLKFPEVGVFPFVKEGKAWKVVLEGKALTQQEVSVISSMVMQQQKAVQSDADYAKYQKQRDAFIKEAQTTKQKFIQQQQQQQGAPQQPPNHP